MISAQVVKSPSYSIQYPASMGLGDDAAILKKVTEQLIVSGRDSSLSGFQSELALDISSAADESIDEGWDGYAGKGADSFAVSEAIALAMKFPEIPCKPIVSIDPIGDVLFQWFNSSTQVLIMSVNRDGRIHFACRNGADRYRGSIERTNKFPRQILSLLTEIYCNG